MSGSSTTLISHSYKTSGEKIKVYLKMYSLTLIKMLEQCHIGACLIKGFYTYTKLKKTTDNSK